MVYDSTPKSGHTIYVSYTKKPTTVPHSHLLWFFFFLNAIARKHIQLKY